MVCYSSHRNPIKRTGEHLLHAQASPNSVHSLTSPWTLSWAFTTEWTPCCKLSLLCPSSCWLNCDGCGYSSSVSLPTGPRAPGGPGLWVCSFHSPLCPSVVVQALSRVWLFATPWTAARQAPPSPGFSRQEHWSGLPFPSPMHESEKWKWSRSISPTLSDPMDYSLPGSSVHGIFQARVLEWGAIALSDGRK